MFGKRATASVAALLLGAGLGLGAAPAEAEDGGRDGRRFREAYVSVDAVRVLKVGRPDARRVLVLTPGMYGAAGDLRVLARDLTRASPGTQVWAVDRREQSRADTRGFEGGDPAAYYLDGHYRRRPPLPEARDWGLATALADLRGVVRQAADSGRRRVVLGGHSWGATTALAYAAWDFGGRPGYRDLAGLVLIDGGVDGAFAGEGWEPRNAPDVVRTRLAAINAPDAPSSALVDDYLTRALGLGDRPETTAVWYQLIAWYAQHAPHHRSLLAARLPEHLRPPRPVTNAGLLGWFMQESPHTHAALSVRSGHLDAAGDWVDDDMTPLHRVAEAQAGPAPTGFEWYWPQRLSLDLEAADAYGDTESARILDLRLHHTREVDVPLYVFETGLDKGTQSAAARRVVANSRIPRATYAADPTMTHLDALFAAPERNELTRTLPAFLRTT
ncbi:alpha/beta hydrolase [Embleya sp. NPDC001921]